MINGEISTYDNGMSHTLSAYEGICCNPDNLGRALTIHVDSVTDRLIFCPDTLTAVCIYTSCENILLNNSSAISGYYNIRADNGSIVSVYCDMESDKCDGEGGWTRIAYINMTEPNATCPSNWEFNTADQHDYCRQQFNLTDRFTCSSVFFSSPSNYSKVCGHVRGHGLKYYQLAFYPFHYYGYNTIDSP